jgi:rare lipoprotein A
MFSISAAHKTLPLGTKVRVTNMENGRELELVVNDRGPFVDGRIIDLSYASARLLGMADNGLARVRVTGIEENPVLANARSSGAVLASAEPAPRKSRATFQEKDISEGPPSA